MRVLLGMRRLPICAVEMYAVWSFRRRIRRYSASRGFVGLDDEEIPAVTEPGD